VQEPHLRPSASISLMFIGAVYLGRRCARLAAPFYSAEIGVVMPSNNRWSGP
jgi:hypothetical protein